jgi:hypothetical protein
MAGLALGMNAAQAAWSSLGAGVPTLRRCACGASGKGGGECEACQKKDQDLQRKATGGSTSTYAPPIVHTVLNTPGEPLSPSTRAFFEQRFRFDFSSVRVHADARAAESARAVAANAYTVGNHLVFAKGRYAPHASEGRRLLAHELAHTVQQSGAGTASARALPVHETHARREYSAGAGVASGAMPLRTAMPVPSLARNTLQREPAPVTADTDLSAISKRLDTIIRTGGPVPTQTRVIAAAIVDVPGYKGSRELRSISSMQTDDAGHGAPVPHAESTPREGRTLSATRSIAGSGARREFPFSHVNDAEMKIFEEISRNLPPEATGTIHFSTERVRQVGGNTVFEPIPACSGCNRATFEMGNYRGVTMISHAATHATGTLDLGSGGAGNTVNPPAPEATPEVGPNAPKAGEGIGPKAGEGATGKLGPKAIEGAEGGLGTRAGKGAAGAGAGGLTLRGAALRSFGSVAVGLATLVGLAVWELVLEPRIKAELKKWHDLVAPLEEERRKKVMADVAQRFDTFKAIHVGRILKSCWIERIRAMEKAKKQAYVRVSLNVLFADSRWLLKHGAPSSIFDIDLVGVDLLGVTVKESAEPGVTGPLQESEQKNFVNAEHLWEQQISFSFEAPSADQIEKEFGKEPAARDCTNDAAGAGCFIATACYGSSVGEELDTLRAFRDRVLSRSRGGRLFTRLYYRHSTPAALWLWSHPLARAWVRRCFISPLVRLIRSLHLMV